MPRRRKTRRPHGSGSVYEKRPGEWVVAFRRGGERQVSDSFPTRALAEQVRDRMAADFLAEKAGQPRDPSTYPFLSRLGDEWINRREASHPRSFIDDRSRWKRHLRPFFGDYRAGEVGTAEIRRFVESKAGELDPATVGHCVRLLSNIYTGLCERAEESGVTANPVRSLPKSLRRQYRATHRPQDTPWLESLEEVARLRDAFPEPFRTMYAAGVGAMLRTGEVLGLHAEDVIFGRRVIRVHQQVNRAKLRGLKDDETREVPLQASLAPVLEARVREVGGSGPLFPTTRQKGGGRPGKPALWMQPRTLHKALREARKKAGTKAVTWYQATRHTGASHWVMSGGSIERLAEILGHSSSEVTLRYAHLVPGRFAPEDYERIALGSPLAPKPPGRKGRKGRKPKQ